MKLTAKAVPYSSIVGGGLVFHDETGRARFIVSLRGTTEGITKAENDEITLAILSALTLPIVVPNREPSP